MPKEDFYVGKKPPITFSLNVIATDLPWGHKDFKIKIVMDFVPKFLDRQKRETPNFNGNRVSEILTFISNKLIKKVLEYIYFDRTNDDHVKEHNKRVSMQKSLTNGQKQEQELALPSTYKKAMEIYSERLKMKAKQKNTTSLAYANYEEDTISDYVNRYVAKKDRPVWDKERNVSRVSYTILSNPTMTVESRTAVNGDKKLPK